MKPATTPSPPARGKFAAGRGSAVSPASKPYAYSPTAAKATSLTSDSTAIASIRPWWCSVASTARVPNRIENRASSRATYSAVSASSGPCPPPAAPASTSTLMATALNCSATYGTAAVRAITVISTARPRLLPKREATKSAIEVMWWRCAMRTRRA